MADLREGLLAPRGAFEGDDDDSALDDPNGDDATRAMGAPWTAAATATISLTMTAVGSVVLSLPATFAECGWLAEASARSCSSRSRSWHRRGPTKGNPKGASKGN